MPVLTEDEIRDPDLRERMRQCVVVIKWGYQMNLLRSRNYGLNVRTKTIEGTYASKYQVGERFGLTRYQSELCMNRARNFIYLINETERERISREKVLGSHHNTDPWRYLDDEPLPAAA